MMKIFYEQRPDEVVKIFGNGKVLKKKKILKVVVKFQCAKPFEIRYFEKFPNSNSCQNKNVSKKKNVMRQQQFILKFVLNFRIFKRKKFEHSISF